MIKPRNKRGQVVIWAIAAIAIVVTFILILLFRQKLTTNITEQQDPHKFIETCTRNAILETAEKMMPQGGFVNPVNYRVYDDIKIEYFCQNIGNYYPCINQHPAFLNELKEEIRKNTIKQVENCFVQLKETRKNRNEEIKFGDMNYSIEFASERIYARIERPTEIEKNGETAKFDNYNYEIESPLYNLASIAVDIATSQAKYCYFEYNGYMILYPRYKITVDTMSDSTKIYKIKDTETGLQMNIAIRSCAVPAGGI